jgi:hypothetical protein
MAGHLKKRVKRTSDSGSEGEIDPDTFLFEDDDEEDLDESSLPPERDALEDEDEDFDDEFDENEEIDWEDDWED